MNIAYAVTMLWRASKNYNVVLALVLNDFHYIETGFSVKKGFWSWCWMFVVATFGYYLLGTFFRKTEVVFRAPMGKKFKEMLALPTMEFQQAFQMSPPEAINRQFILDNTGFCTHHPPWELCYAAAMDACRLADDGVFDLKNWELSVWQKDGHHQWTVWEIWRHQDAFLYVKAIEIMKKRIKKEGDKLLARLKNMQLASVGSAPLSDPVKQEPLHSNITRLSGVEGFDVGESSTEAIPEVDWISNQLSQLQ